MNSLHYRPIYNLTFYKEKKAYTSLLVSHIVTWMAKALLGNDLVNT
jgi:hypothetical protein